MPWYPEMRNHRVARGRFFTDADMEASASVCVLGANVAEALFPLDSPLGRDVRVGEDYYRVIGVMGPRAQPTKEEAAQQAGKKPNILVIWGDDIGYWNVSVYNQGMMGYRTPNINRIAREGALFTDSYGQ